MLLEGVIIRSKLNADDVDNVLTFDVMDGEELISIRIPAGGMRESLISEAGALEVGERVDLYIALVGTIHYLKGITHYIGS